MEQDTETPFSREPWRKLLQESAEAPPEITDARIRNAARRALAPRFSRWWLPASLAASVLLAVLIVEQQYGGREPAEVATESDYARPPAPVSTPAASTRRDEKAPRAPASTPPPPQPARELAPTPPAAEPRAARPQFVPDQRETARASSVDQELDNVAATGSRIRGPEREIEESSEMPMEEARVEATSPAHVTPPAVYSPTAAKARAPEDWYAEIEKLRAEGRAEDADRELERLKAAYPGWLERRLEDEKRR